MLVKGIFPERCREQPPEGLATLASRLGTLGFLLHAYKYFEDSFFSLRVNGGKKETSISSAGLSILRS